MFVRRSVDRVSDSQDAVTQQLYASILLFLLLFHRSINWGTIIQHYWCFSFLFPNGLDFLGRLVIMWEFNQPSSGNTHCASNICNTLLVEDDVAISYEFQLLSKLAQHVSHFLVANENGEHYEWRGMKGCPIDLSSPTRRTIQSTGH